MKVEVIKIPMKVETVNIARVRVLACDPSMTAWGWAVISMPGFRVMAAGCIKTAAESKQRKIRKGDDRVRRISEMNRELLGIIEKYKISYMVSEQPHGSQSAVAAVMIGNVTGMLQTLSDCLKIPLEWYSEGDAKNNLLKKRSAAKLEVKNAIAGKYTVPWTGVGFRDEAIADSLAVFDLAVNTSPMLMYYRK